MTGTHCLASGDRWTVAEAAQHVRMNTDDFIKINTELGAQENNMLEHHIMFCMPVIAQLTSALHGQTREDVTAELEPRKNDIETALRNEFSP